MKTIIYGLGKCWEDNYKKIKEKYDIVACSDRDDGKSTSTKGNVFIKPECMRDYGAEIILICTYSYGIREQLMLEYGLDITTIFYFIELEKGVELTPRKILEYEDVKLTIIIPTYNRKERLGRTLELLQMQRDKKFKIVILDNASDYDVNELIIGKKLWFVENIRIVRNNWNTGMTGNLSLMFLQETEGWIWTISDDDIPSIYAVEYIKYIITKNKYAGAVFFPILDFNKYIKEYKIIKNLSDLMSFYHRCMKEDIKDLEGDFIYLSNKVYNLDMINKYIDRVFMYSYTAVPQIIPILCMLEDNKELVIANKKIIAFSMGDGGHWDYFKVALGMSTIVDIPCSLSKKELKIWYRLVMLDYHRLFREMDKEKYKIEILYKLYFRIYKKYLKAAEKREYFIGLWKLLHCGDRRLGCKLKCK